MHSLTTPGTGPTGLQQLGIEERHQALLVYEDIHIPKTYKQAMASPKAEQW